MKLLILITSLFLASCATYDLNAEGLRSHNCSGVGGGYYDPTSNMSSYDKAIYNGRDGRLSGTFTSFNQAYNCLDNTRVK